MMVARLSLGLLLLVLLLPMQINSFVPLTSTPGATYYETTKPTTATSSSAIKTIASLLVVLLTLLHLYY
uniref:Uncharacterized protein n=1 Tax=Marmota marmota marmota TaxID=9994 RepID=A0A8C5Z3W5_MARMA